MMKTDFEVPIDDLTKEIYTLMYVAERGEVRLVGYKLVARETARKRIYNVVRWYNWYNNRDRNDSKFIPLDQIRLPQSVKDAFVENLIEGLTFITTERK